MKELTMLNRSNKFRYKLAQYKADIPQPRKNEIVIIPEDNRMDDFRPYLGTQKLPSWWNLLPKGKGTLRRCQGTYDFISLGGFVPLWTNVHIRPNITHHHYDIKLDPIDGFQFRHDGFTPETSTGCPIEKHKSLETGQYIKLVTPWRFITPKGVSLMSLPVMHEPDANFSVIPGIVHTDYYHQINVVINVHSDKEFVIPAGTPIMQLIPFKRDTNTKKIVWGNESMHRFVASSGLGEGSLITEDKSLMYRRLQRRADGR